MSHDWVANVKSGIFFVFFLFSSLFWTLFSIKGYGELKPIVVAYPEFKPLSYVEDGVKKGICVDIMASVFSKYFKLEISELPWKRAQAGLESGVVDLIPCIVKSADREQFAIFSDPIADVSFVFLTYKDSPINITQLSDVRQLRAATFRGDSIYNIYDPTTLTQVADVPSLLKFIARKRADIAVVSRILFETPYGELSEEEKSKLKILDFTFSLKAYFAISKKSPLSADMSLINKLVNEEVRLLPAVRAVR